MGRLIFLLIACTQLALAQQGTLVYDNRVYSPFIKTVQCYNTQKEQSLPILTLNSAELLHFSFDDLQAGSKNYWYEIEHCTADWKPSGISTLDYVESFAEDRIVAYQYSSGTLQKFTHYSLSLSNEQVKMKTSGNYLLKVYEVGKIKKLLISQRLYVVENLVSINLEVKPSTQVEERATNQKINFTVTHRNLTIQNPNQDLKIVVMQNGNPQTALKNSKPSFIKPGILVYNDLKSNNFKGGNEFRKFDIRSLRYPGAKVQEITKDSSFSAVLIPDLSRSSENYSSQLDENGSFYIRNQDGRTPETESDYVNVAFTLKALASHTKGEVYVLGRFNNYTLNAESKLNYDPDKKAYAAKIYLKQGLYDYKYFYKDEQGNMDETLYEGSYFETNNDYQVFVYFRKPGSRWDELIGYSFIKNAKPI
ncbi:hypothetical protein AAKU52_001512 [Pedobacter sp. CG_S7]|uniref:type IX secretion system plug protein n=1 Tax=Pedobacter sp. CG_S7 TaxID=3143930 RepID=UPI00339A3BAE